MMMVAQDDGNLFNNLDIDAFINDESLDVDLEPIGVNDLYTNPDLAISLEAEAPTLAPPMPVSVSSSVASPVPQPVAPAGNLPDDVTDLISNALGQLSVGDREKTYFEVHGVATPIDETPEFVERKVNELHQELIQLTRHVNLPIANAFKLAEMQNPEFAYNHVYCRRFLRGADFEADKAAMGMLRYFQWKLQLWGESRLCREIELEDLDEDDIEVLKKGYFQLLPERDRAGRPVSVLILNDDHQFPSADAAGRAMWYTYQQRLEQKDESMAVGVIMHLAVPSLSNMDPELLMMFKQLSSCMPSKKAAYHHCVTDSSSLLFRAFVNHVVVALDRENQARTKFHNGSTTEWIYSLMTYGIPPHLIPITDDGKIKTKNHMEFLQARKAREQYSRKGIFNLVSLPLNSDVLLGRGKPIQQHAGNLRLQAIVDTYVLEYHKLQNKTEKTALASQVVRMVKAAGARFLSKEDGLWMEVGDEVAREKVSGLFRTLYRTRHADARAAANNASPGKAARSNNAVRENDGHAAKKLRTLSADESTA